MLLQAMMNCLSDSDSAFERSLAKIYLDSGVQKGSWLRELCRGIRE